MKNNHERERCRMMKKDKERIPCRVIKDDQGRKCVKQRDSEMLREGSETPRGVVHF